jgi:PAS domain S-box-containing protein
MEIPNRPSTGLDHSRAGKSDAVDLRSLLVDSVLDYGIFALDPGGCIVTWNPGAERLQGYKAEEIIGRHFSTFYTQPDIDRGWPERELAIAVAEGRFEDEGWRVRKDGSHFWANVVITALRGPDGRLLGFGKVTRDLTERKAGEDILRESEERFRLLVSAVSDYAIFLLNPDGTVATWNAGAEQLKGYRADEIIGHHFSAFYTAEDKAAGVPQEALAQALATGRWESEGWRVRTDGTRFWANVVITSLHGAEGQHRGFAKVTRDLTERKRNDDALRGVLEREREAAARLRELDQMKTDLVAIVAHDLREPVGVIQSLLALLDDSWDTLSDQRRRDTLARVQRRTGSLSALVDDLFDLSLIESEKLEVDAVPFRLDAVATQVVDDARVLAPDREILVEAEAVEAIGDERRTWQIVSNLVSNALKYSPGDRPVRIRVGQVGREAHLSVEDSGAGMRVSDHDLAFERFGRLPGDSHLPGTGMGLYIARSLAEAQGGRLTVESEVGAGSTFCLELPAHES